MDEVFKIQGNRDMEGIKETQKLKLGDAKGIPNEYLKKYQASKLGDAPVGIPPSSTTIGQFWLSLSFCFFT